MDTLASLREQQQTLERRLREITQQIDGHPEELNVRWANHTGLPQSIREQLGVTSLMDGDLSERRDPHDWEGYTLTFKQSPPLKIMFCDLGYNWFEVGESGAKSFPADEWDLDEWCEEHFGALTSPTSVELWESLAHLGIPERLALVMLHWQESHCG